MLAAYWRLIVPVNHNSWSRIRIRPTMIGCQEIVPEIALHIRHERAGAKIASRNRVSGHAPYLVGPRKPLRADHINLTTASLRRVRRAACVKHVAITPIDPAEHQARCLLSFPW